ncbi:hypothetical protein COW64_25835, partial [bacterium (Candidatus Blackallbacteria) CG18_big_fil_WC_8_21_14_2_50_49_26]
QQEVTLHTKKTKAQTDNLEELTTRSFSIYRSDIQHIEELADKLSEFRRKKVNNSLVIRVALNYLRESLKKNKDSVRFEQEMERIIKDSI